MKGEMLNLKESKVWLYDVLDDIDIYLAQRQFEEAVDLISREKSEIGGSSNFSHHS